MMQFVLKNIWGKKKISEKTKNNRAAWKTINNTAMSSQKKKHRQSYLQHYLILSIRLFSVIYRTPVEESLTLCRGAVDVFYSLSRLNKRLQRASEENSPGDLRTLTVSQNPVKNNQQTLSKFLRRSLLIFIIKGFRTIVFIFIVISTMFRTMFPAGHMA